MEITSTELVLFVWGFSTSVFGIYMANQYKELAKVIKTLMYLIETKQTDKITILRNESN